MKFNPWRVRVSDEYVELIPWFLEARRNDMKRAREAIQNKDFTELVEIGHTLVGVGSPLGVEELTRLGRRLRDCAHEQDLRAASDLLRRITQGLNEFEQAQQKG